LPQEVQKKTVSAISHLVARPTKPGEISRPG
jgi:hypothetical protein